MYCLLYRQNYNTHARTHTHTHTPIHTRAHAHAHTHTHTHAKQYFVKDVHESHEGVCVTLLPGDKLHLWLHLHKKLV